MGWIIQNYDDGSITVYYDTDEPITNYSQFSKEEWNKATPIRKGFRGYQPETNKFKDRKDNLNDNQIKCLESYGS